MGLGGTLREIAVFRGILLGVSIDDGSPLGDEFGSRRERAEPGAFEPGTVLGLFRDFDVTRHDVLHRVHQLVRASAGEAPLPPHETARITFRDLAGIIEAFRILIERDVPAGLSSRRMDTAKLARDLLDLRRFGFSHPLLQARLAYDGGALAVGGGQYETSGQLFLTPPSGQIPQFMRAVYGQFDQQLVGRLRAEYESAGRPDFGTFEDRFTDPK